jgi:hypothetical protein
MSILALLLAGCQPPPYTPPDSGRADTGFVDTGAADAGPTLDIIFPPNETVAEGECQMFVVVTTGIALVDPMESPTAVEGEGHYHIIHSDTYALCDEPYCLVGFTEAEVTPPEGSEVPAPVQFTAQLMDNEHNPILDADGNVVAESIFVTPTDAECTEGSPSGYP